MLEAFFNILLGNRSYAREVILARQTGMRQAREQSGARSVHEVDVPCHSFETKRGH